MKNTPLTPLKGGIDRADAGDVSPASFNEETFLSLDELLSCSLLPNAPPRANERYHFPRKLTEAEIGSWLARVLFNQKSFYGMRLVQRGPERVTYHVYEEEASTRVLELFFEKAKGKSVFGVKNHFAFTRLPNAALKNAEGSFKQGWKEMLAGQTHPLSELWNDIADEKQ